MEMGQPCPCHVKMGAASPFPYNQSEELHDEAFVHDAGAGDFIVSPHLECSGASTPHQSHSEGNMMDPVYAFPSLDHSNSGIHEPHFHRDVEKYGFKFFIANHSEDCDEPVASSNVQSSVQNNNPVSVDNEEPIANDLGHKRNLSDSLYYSCDSGNDMYSKDPDEELVNTRSRSSHKKLSGCLRLTQSIGGSSLPNGKDGRSLWAANMRAKSKARNISFSLQNSLREKNYVPARQTAGDDDRARDSIDGFAKLCPPNPDTSSEYSHHRNSSLLDRNQEKLSRMDPKRVNNTETINEKNSAVLQKRHGKVFRTSQTELKTNHPLKTQSGKPHRAQQPQSVQKHKNSSQAVTGSANQPIPASRQSAKALEMNQTQTPPVTKWVWKVKEKVEASKDSSISSLIGMRRKREKTEPIKDSSKPSPRANALKEKKQHSKGQVRGKTEPNKDSSISSSKAWCIKEKKQPSKDSSNLSSRKKSSSQSCSKHTACEHHITWDGFKDESNEKLGQSCSLCSDDLAYSPESPKLELGSRSFPDVAILPCGHAFHLLCLSCSMSLEQMKDPPCIVCEKLS